MLPVRRQLELAGIEAPLAVRHLRARSAGWLAVYLAAAALILGIVAHLIVSNQERLLDLVIRYVMPDDWKVAAKFLVKKVFSAQEQAVLTNAALSASLMIVTITLFPLKEKVSATLEEDAELLAEPFDEHPLWFEAWEEIKLFLAMLAAQGAIFWIGYTDDPARRTLALVLSYLVLFASVGIDFLSPILQRHRQTYSVMLKSFACNPVLTLAFGALFATPAIVTARIVATHTDWSGGTQLAFSFGAQLIGIALAAIGGTVAGAPLLADAKTRRPSHVAAKIATWAAVIGLLAWNANRFYGIGSSINHKSQILKCEYDVDWTSFSADVPSAFELAVAVRSDQITLGIHFDVAITNPTSIDVDIEDNHLDVTQEAQLIAQTHLPRLHVRAHSTEKTRIALPLTIRPTQALRIRELITTKSWALTLWLHIDDGFDFPIYLL